MSASCLHSDATRPVLLATLGGAIVSIIVCAGAFQRFGAAPIAVPSPDGDGATLQVASIAPHELEFVRIECESTPSPVAFEAETALPQDSVIVPVTRAKERELRAAFVALERAEPGSLDARAGALLAGGGPTTGKVALLRALRDTASPTTAHWLDFTVRASPTDASGHAQPLPTFALEQLTELAVGDADACATLGRLAFDTAGVGIELRRRASAGFAAVCPPDSLSNLNRQLWREPDELVIASVLSSLESRSAEPQARRVLDAHRPARCATIDAASQPSN